MSCKNCKKRQIGCHASCEDYQNEKQEREALKDKIKKEKEKQRELDYVEIERRRKLKKGVRNERNRKN